MENYTQEELRRLIHTMERKYDEFTFDSPYRPTTPIDHHYKYSQCYALEYYKACSDLEDFIIGYIKQIIPTDYIVEVGPYNEKDQYTKFKINDVLFTLVITGHSLASPRLCLDLWDGRYNGDNYNEILKILEENKNSKHYFSLDNIKRFILFNLNKRK